MEREKKIIRWLQNIKEDAAKIFLVGDLFDFWFEYSKVIPKGFVRFQGKIAELTDAGIEVHFFAGNHDLWLRHYFAEELGVQVHLDCYEFSYQNASFYVGHGDALGSGDYSYKMLKKMVFQNPLFRWLFNHLMPVNFGVWLAHTWSASRKGNMKTTFEHFKGKEKEWLWNYCMECEQKKHRDYYIFGHRHLPLDLEVSVESRYINLGEWINYFSYAKFDGERMQLLYFDEK